MPDETPARHLHKLPFVHPQHVHAVLGLGRFVWQTVTDAPHAKGLFVYFHAEGAEEAVRGWMPVECRIGDDLEISWEAVKHAGSLDDPDRFPPEAWAVAVQLADHVGTVQEITLMRNVMAVIEPVVQHHDALLASHLKSAHRLRNLAMIDHADPEKVARHEDSISAIEQRIQKFRTANSDRIDRLRPVVEAIREWSSTPKDRRPPFLEMYAEATKLPSNGMSMS